MTGGGPGTGWKESAITAAQWPYPPQTPAEEAVLAAFVKDGRIVRFPARRARRVLLLDQVAKLFEPGVRYPERDVNQMLGRLHDDFAALRRYLVDEGFLSRGGGEYWRSGGTVDR